MLRVDRLLQILVILTVGLSGLLLGMGQNDLNPLVIALTGAITAFFLVDWLRWFHLPQWLANLIAVLVTIFTVTSFFFDGDSVRQLLGVGKLLVYLQTILLFQRKTARVYWQVLVLSLLQIVVAAVFNLGFEGGVLFILYMMVAGFAMMVLHLYQDSQIIVDRNDVQRQKIKSKSRTLRPIAVFASTCRDQSIVRRMLRHFSVVGIGSLGFALFLFYFLPRENSSWSGPLELPMRMTGYNQSINLDHPSMILLSNKLVMTVTYRDPLLNGPIKTKEQPYLRGMVLPNVVIDDNRTTWAAAHDQIYATNDFLPIPGMRGGSRHVIQDIVLEPTDDPLLFSANPPRRHDDTPAEFTRCWPLGAITRQHTGDKIQFSHFRYELRVPILADGSFFKSVPYVSRHRVRNPLTSAADRGNYRWLTDMDPSRYPVVVATAQQIVEDLAGPSASDFNELTVARRMERYFLDEGRFRYTLDFRDIALDKSIDCVEDFFANHRSGHCEYFASALTLMLRSQGIPARMVIGYRGGNENEFGEHLDVEARHAHAWVEAYIRPKNCTNEMRASGQAGRLGAWLRLDPTPATGDADMLLGADDALALAKSLWRDYVLGLQADRSANSVIKSDVRLSGFLRVLDLDWWQGRFGDFSAAFSSGKAKWTLTIIVGAAILLFIGSALAIFAGRRGFFDKNQKHESQPNFLRRRIGKLVEYVSPGLGNWISGNGENGFVEVGFYRQFTHLLQRYGFQRTASQTQREFAAEVALRLSDTSPESNAPRIMRQITDLYYLVRFGTQALNENQLQSVNQALGQLQSELTEFQSRSVSAEG